MSETLPTGLRLLSVVEKNWHHGRMMNLTIWFTIGICAVVVFNIPILVIPAMILLVGIWYIWRRFAPDKPVSQLIALDEDSQYLMVCQFEAAFFSFGYRSKWLFFDIPKMTAIGLGQQDDKITLDIHGETNEVHRVILLNPDGGSAIVQAVTQFQTDHQGVELNPQTRQERANFILTLQLAKLLKMG